MGNWRWAEAFPFGGVVVVFSAVGNWAALGTSRGRTGVFAIRGEGINDMAARSRVTAGLAFATILLSRGCLSIVGDLEKRSGVTVPFEEVIKSICRL